MTPILSVSSLCVDFKKRPLLKDISFSVSKNSLHTVLGPSGSGKSTLLRSLNRLLDEDPGFSVQGIVSYQGENIYGSDCDRYLLRRKIGMVFQKPTVFPISIAANVLFGRTAIHRVAKKTRPALVEKYLKEVSLWDEVSDRLHSPATQLSVGQQQRLALARTLAMEPELILLDEPTSALDKESSQNLQALMLNLKKTRTLVLVTHDLTLAQSLSDSVTHLSPNHSTGSVLG